MPFKIVGNGKAATILILIFIVILCCLFWRKAHSAEVVLRVGSSFAAGGTGPVAGIDVRWPQGNAVDLYAGTLLWGSTDVVDTNWDWHVGVHTCRWRVCASIGATYLQKTDRLDGSHTNFNLGLTYLVDWKRFQGVSFFHLSNAGTISPNIGRNAALADITLQ